MTRTVCFDFGNTRLKGAIFDEDKFTDEFVLTNDDPATLIPYLDKYRPQRSISAYRDAQGFRKGKTKLNVKLIDAYIYHYGWVKSPKQMKQKMKHVSRFWNEDSEDWQGFIKSEDVFNFDDFDSLVEFKGTHPAVMQQRVSGQHWKLPIDISKKRFSFKNRLLYHFEKLTGIRPFDFKNYKILK